MPNDIIISAPSGYWLFIAEYVGDKNSPTGLEFFRSPIIAWALRDGQFVRPITLDTLNPFDERVYDHGIELPDGQFLDDGNRIYQTAKDWENDTKKSFPED